MSCSRHKASLSRTVDLFQDSWGGWVSISPWWRSRGNPPIEVVFEREVLRDEDGLTVLFDHVKVVRGVYAALEQDPVRWSDAWAGGRVGRTCWLHI